MPETGNSIINWLVADFHFFGYVGQNWMPALFATAILVYALSTFVAKLGSIINVADGITAQTWIYEHWFAPLAQPKNASLAFALCYVALWTLVAWGLYRKKIFVKV